jgi:sugar (pentulose or hexulose) kinase
LKEVWFADLKLDLRAPSYSLFERVEHGSLEKIGNVTQIITSRFSTPPMMISPTPQSHRKRAVLGIDNGTQGLTALLVDIDDLILPVIAAGEGSYGFVPDLPNGCYEHRPSDWEEALKAAIQQILTNNPSILDEQYQLVAIGVAGQMHGHVSVDAEGNAIGTARLWCDSRNQEEAQELSQLFFQRRDNLPKRVTVARWLWTMRNQPELAKKADFLTTPAGFLCYLLTSQKTLGIGDASGMFPMDSSTKDYRQDLMNLFQDKYREDSVQPLSSLLPKVIVCGEDAGSLTADAAAWLGLPQETVGIPVAPAEGDQPAALVGSLIGEAGMVSCSFGTSVCANAVGGTSEDSSAIISPIVNHFSSVNGEPIYMVWLRNGTTFFNTMVRSYGTSSKENEDNDVDHFVSIMPQVLDAPADCGGLLAMPFMDDEPGLGVMEGGTATLMGWNGTNSTAGNACKAALLSTMFNLKQGMDYLQGKNVKMTEIFLSGGLTKTPELGQVVADVYELPVHLLEGAEEGCAWGSAVLAKYRWLKSQKEELNWVEFLKGIQTKPSQSFTPYPPNSAMYQSSYEKNQALLKLQPQLLEAMNKS